MLRYVKNGMLLLSVAYIVIGMLLLIMPETSLLWICNIFGVVVLVTGIVCLIQYARIRGTGFTAPFMLVGGVITAGLGIFTLAKPQVVASFLPIVFGIFIVVDGLSRIGSAIDLAKQPLFEFIIGIQEQNVVTRAFFYCGPMPKVQAFVLAFANNRDSLIVFGVLFENRRRTIAARIVNDNELVVGERLIQHAINTRTQIALAVENRYANRKAGHRPLLPE